MFYIFQRGGLLFGTVLLVVSGTLAVLRQEPSKAFFLLTRQPYVPYNRSVSSLFTPRGDHVRDMPFVRDFVLWSSDGQTVIFTVAEKLYRVDVLHDQKPTLVLELEDDGLALTTIGNFGETLIPVQHGFVISDQHHAYWVAEDGREAHLIYETDNRIAYSYLSDGGRSAMVILTPDTGEDVPGPVDVIATVQVNLDTLAIVETFEGNTRPVFQVPVNFEESAYGTVYSTPDKGFYLETLEKDIIYPQLPDDSYEIRHWIAPNRLVLAQNTFGDGGLDTRLYTMDLQSNEIHEFFHSEDVFTNYVNTVWHEKFEQLYIYFYLLTASTPTGSVYAYDPATDTLTPLLESAEDIGIYSTHDRIAQIGWSENADRLFYTENQQGSWVYKMLDLQTHASQTLYETPNRASKTGFRMGPDGKTVMIDYHNVPSPQHAEYHLVLVDVNSPEIVHLITGHSLTAVSPIIDRPHHFELLSILSGAGITVFGLLSVFRYRRHQKGQG